MNPNTWILDKTHMTSNQSVNSAQPNSQQCTNRQPKSAQPDKLCKYEYSVFTQLRRLPTLLA
ncbi:hypothetical protein E2C01_051921 [Portunus trituberculatus]|uniref:Uncharacterized protein n=1 Tax=Portunus trituberculatus TaxID=210409 RepID=A0A5B7GK30_PORTR|nr:hypothetical protein [Portunus trituberculatus]